MVPGNNLKNSLVDVSIFIDFNFVDALFKVQWKITFICCSSANEFCNCKDREQEKNLHYRDIFKGGRHRTVCLADCTRNKKKMKIQQERTLACLVSLYFNRASTLHKKSTHTFVCVLLLLLLQVMRSVPQPKKGHITYHNLVLGILSAPTMRAHCNFLPCQIKNIKYLLEADSSWLCVNSDVLAKGNVENIFMLQFTSKNFSKPCALFVSPKKKQQSLAFVLLRFLF